MDLYIVRHGVAVDVGEQGVETDYDRPLSVAGRRKTRAAMHGLKRLGHAPERVASSPLRRAWETAEIAARELGCGSGVERCDLLKPGVPIVKLREWVIGRGAKESVMLVGHMPGLARLVSHLLAGDDRVEVVFKKSAVCRLTRSITRRGAPYRLDWLLQPRQLRAIRADARRG